MSVHSLRRRCPLLLLCLTLAVPVQADLPLEAVPLDDLLEVLVVDRDVLAFDGLGTKTFSERLKLHEEVLHRSARGAVGVVFTNRRAMAVSSASSEWQRIQWRLDERIPSRAMLGDRLALLATDQRILGFTIGAGIWLEEEVGPNETVLDVRAGRNSGVVVTDRRALGISPSQASFRDVKLRLHEKVEQIVAESNLATITTSQRILVFRVGSGAWSTLKREIR